MASQPVLKIRQRAKGRTIKKNLHPFVVSEGLGVPLVKLAGKYRSTGERFWYVLVEAVYDGYLIREKHWQQAS